ncbi:MAG: hypothetical protein CL489_16620 [Acidobacteria bacterium]|nr:hypothetical protein [Acidobacteriota bacterium]|tara:strand:+ start:1606 stop:2889 length:1284 start_codon:yes stop_codon:yes gene_type:complete
MANANDQLKNTDGDFLDNQLYKALDGDDVMYVDKERGSDSNPGTKARPKKTINAAITSMHQILGKSVMKFIAVEPDQFDENIVLNTPNWCFLNAEWMKTGPLYYLGEAGFSFVDLDDDGEPAESSSRSVIVRPTSGIPLLISNDEDFEYDDIDYTETTTAYSWDGADLNGLTESSMDLTSSSTESYRTNIYFVGFNFIGTNANANAKMLGAAAVGRSVGGLGTFYGLTGISFIGCSIQLGALFKNCSVEFKDSLLFQGVLDNCRIAGLYHCAASDLTIRADDGAAATEAPVQYSGIFSSSSVLDNLIVTTDLSIQIAAGQTLISNPEGNSTIFCEGDVTINGGGTVSFPCDLKCDNLNINDTVTLSLDNVTVETDMTVEDAASDVDFDTLLVKGNATIGASSSVNILDGGAVGTVTGTITRATLNVT